MPLLEELLTEPRAETQRIWLDLGPAQNGLLIRLQARRGCVVVADLPRALAAGRPRWHLPESVLPEQHWRRALNRILVWNLFDYLDPIQLGELARQLAPRAAPGCRIHALIHYALPDMPDAPPIWRTDLDGNFESVASDDPVRSAPRHSPKALEKAMPEFRVERTVLLNNGMQEFVLSVRN